MQNLNNYNDQFRQAASLQQVSLQDTASQRRLTITNSTTDNSIDIENRNPFYQKSKDRQKDNFQRSRNDYRERDDYHSQNYQSNYQQLIYLSSILILAYYANSTIYFESTYYTSSRQETSFYFETSYNDSIVYAKFNEHYNEIYYVESDNVVEDAYTSNEHSTKAFITIQTNALHVDLKITTSSSRSFTCRICNNIFDFNNKLHKHFKRCKRSLSIEIFHVAVAAKLFTIDSNKDVLIESNVSTIIDTRLVFRSWHYVTTIMSFFCSKASHDICIDTDCTMSLIDRVFVTNLKLVTQIKKVNVSIFVRDIDTLRHVTNDYLMLSMYIQDTIDKRKVTTHLRREIHVVDNFKIKFLLSMNVMNFERMIIDMNLKQLIIKSCQSLVVKFEITVKNNIRVRRTLRAERKLVVEINIIVKLLIDLHDDSILDKDYLFEFSFSNTYAHIVDVFIWFVYVKNDLNTSLEILRHAHMNQLVEFEKQNCYQISSEDHVWAINEDIKIDIFEDNSQSRLANEINVYDDFDEIIKL